MEIIFAELEAGLALALNLSIDEDNHYRDRAGYMVAMWKTGDKHEAAKAYVKSYFAQFGDKVRIIETERSSEVGAVDVSFSTGFGTQYFTVWMEDMGNGPFIYGEY